MSITRRIERLEAGEPEHVVYEVYIPEPTGTIECEAGDTPVARVVYPGDPEYGKDR